MAKNSKQASHKAVSEARASAKAVNEETVDEEIAVEAAEAESIASEAEAAEADASMAETSEYDIRYTLDWHLTLTNILLWVLAAVNVYEGVRLVTGNVYHSLRSQVYSYFAGLQLVNTIFGVCFILWAGYAVFTRFQLARFKTGAPRHLRLLDAMGFVLGLAHLLATSLVTKTALTAELTASNVVMLVVNAALLALNSVYYHGIGSLFNK